jgi:hypothetical protein
MSLHPTREAADGLRPINAVVAGRLELGLPCPALWQKQRTKKNSIYKNKQEETIFIYNHVMFSIFRLLHLH